MKSRPREQGLSLIELVVVIAVLAVAIPPLTGLYSEVAGATVDDGYQAHAVTLANSLMEEIISKEFEDPDLSSGSFGTEEGSRAIYDDIDDFDGLSNSPPTALNGVDLDDYSSITRSVIVDNVTIEDPDPVNTEADGSTPLKRIRVTVAWTGGRGGAITLSTLRASLVNAEDPEIIDEAASAATAYQHDDDHFHIDLVSLSLTDLVIASIELSASASTPNLKEIKLNNKKIISNLDLALPTGTAALNAGSASDRTIEAGDDPNARIKFKDDIEDGTYQFTLVLHFTDGSSDSVTFSLSF